MMMRDGQYSIPKQVHFANGFPPKELVPTPGPSATLNMHGGFFVGLHDDIPSRVTCRHPIPPLAKGRGQFCALKHMNKESKLLQLDQTDPFKGHKGSEKTGFSPHPIKHSKLKFTKTIQCNSKKNTKSSSAPPRIPSNLPRSISYTSHTGITTSNTPECDPIPKDLGGSCYKIMSDVEKELTELSGIDEVYQRVCNGNINSLYSLISPVKSKRKKYSANMQYIQTSSPLALNTKHKLPNSSKTAREKDHEFSFRSVLLNNGNNCMDNEIPEIPPKQPRAILVPLPYFQKNPHPPPTTPARHKPLHDRPRIYAVRSERHRTISSLSGWSSPSVINFNPLDLPDINCTGTRSCNVTGSIVGVQNKSQTGTVAIVASLESNGVTATPPATAAAGFYADQSLFEDVNDIDMERRQYGTVEKEDYESLELESVVSEGINAAQSQGINIEKQNHKHNNNNKSETADVIRMETEVANDLAQSDGRCDSDMTGNGTNDVNINTTINIVADEMQNLSLSITLNVTNEGGKTDSVEIYDPDKRDLEKEKQVAQEVLEAREIYEKRKREVETLLSEHEDIIKEVINLEKQLH